MKIWKIIWRFTMDYADGEQILICASPHFSGAQPVIWDKAYRDVCISLYSICTIWLLVVRFALKVGILPLLCCRFALKVGILPLLCCRFALKVWILPLLQRSSGCKIFVVTDKMTVQNFVAMHLQLLHRWFGIVQGQMELLKQSHLFPIWVCKKCNFKWKIPVFQIMHGGICKTLHSFQIVCLVLWLSCCLEQVFSSWDALKICKQKLSMKSFSKKSLHCTKLMTIFNNKIVLNIFQNNTGTKKQALFSFIREMRVILKAFRKRQDFWLIWHRRWAQWLFLLNMWVYNNFGWIYINTFWQTNRSNAELIIAIFLKFVYNIWTGLIWKQIFILTTSNIIKRFQRYYGKSLPFGEKSFDSEHIGLLTVEQALADYAYLLEHLKEVYNASSAPVITFGGRWDYTYIPMLMHYEQGLTSTAKATLMQVLRELGVGWFYALCWVITLILGWFHRWVIFNAWSLHKLLATFKGVSRLVIANFTWLSTFY